MMAVCGMGIPKGCRKRAVTANQSASPPTIPASAAARRYPTHAASPMAKVEKNTIVVNASTKPAAMRAFRSGSMEGRMAQLAGDGSPGHRWGRGGSDAPGDHGIGAGWFPQSNSLGLNSESWVLSAKRSVMPAT
jgi:hypothetical protein